MQKNILILQIKEISQNHDVTVITSQIISKREMAHAGNDSEDV
jgi:hypothetical protein